MSETQAPSLVRRLVAEFLGTAGLLASIIGSGIMGDNLAGGNAGVALIGCTLAISAALVVLIWLFGPVSGCHINPAVTLAFLVRGEIAPRDAAAYVPVQILGGIAGTAVTNVMFGLPALHFATTVRTGPSQWLSEIIATFGLLIVILGCLRVGRDVAVAVARYIGSAIWFTSSTAFANPAVSIARAFSDTFCGIRPADVAPFIGMEVVGALAAVWFARWLWR